VGSRDTSNPPTEIENGKNEKDGVRNYIGGS